MELINSNLVISVGDVNDNFIVTGINFYLAAKEAIYSFIPVYSNFVPYNNATSSMQENIEINWVDLSNSYSYTFPLIFDV